MRSNAVLGLSFGFVEVKPGQYRPEIVEKSYPIDILRNYQIEQTTTFQNDDLVLNNKISVLLDLYLKDNFPRVKYVKWKGIKWKVKSLEISYPRLILEIGGVYNENTNKISN